MHAHQSPEVFLLGMTAPVKHFPLFQSSSFSTSITCQCMYYCSNLKILLYIHVYIGKVYICTMYMQVQVLPEAVPFLSRAGLHLVVSPCESHGSKFSIYIVTVICKMEVTNVYIHTCTSISLPPITSVFPSPSADSSLSLYPVPLPILQE